jgi:hypothetical protein
VYLIAAGLAALSLVSMVIGTFIGVYAKPTQRTNAIIMAFGTGALIQALAIELALKGAQRLTDRACSQDSKRGAGSHPASLSADSSIIW